MSIDLRLSMIFFQHNVSAEEGLENRLRVAEMHKLLYVVEFP